MTPNNRLLLQLLKITCFALFLGRAWQHLFWDAPIRTLLWDESLMSGVITGLFGIPWKDYATSMSTDAIIQGIIRGFGIFYLLMAVLVLMVHTKLKFAKPLLYLSSILLAFLAFLYCKEKFFHFAQFFEYTIQVISPILLANVIFNPERLSSRNLVFVFKTSIALTFAAHGMYAIGYYPRPGVFVDMTINILGISEPMAHNFLGAAGILDFAAAVMIFIPRLSFWGIAYCVIWGFLTAFARTWANLDLGPSTVNLLHQFLPQTVYRLPHGLLPLALLVWQFELPKLFKSNKFNKSKHQDWRNDNIEKTLVSNS